MHHELNTSPIDLNGIKDTGPLTGHGPHVEAWSGTAVYPLRPRVEDVKVVDIIQASAITNRYNGHTDFPISLAQHSCTVARLLEGPLRGSDNLVRWGLLHDAAEVYVGDMVRPLKLVSPRFSNIEDLNFQCIIERFKLLSLSEEEEGLLKRADDMALMLEVAGAKAKRTTWGKDLDELYEWAKKADLAYRVYEQTWRESRHEYCLALRKAWPGDAALGKVARKLLGP